MKSASSDRPQGAAVPKKTRRAVACNHCRGKKIRCNGEIPCANCLDHDAICVVPARRRPRIQGSQGHDSADLSRRVHQIESLLGAEHEGSKAQRRGEHVDVRRRTRPPETPRPGVIDCTSPLPSQDELRSNQDIHGETTDAAFESHQIQQGSGASQELIFIHHHQGVHTVTPPQDSNLSPQVFDEQEIEQEGSSVYATAEVGCTQLQSLQLTQPAHPILEYYGNEISPVFIIMSILIEIRSEILSMFLLPARGRLGDRKDEVPRLGTLSASRAPEPSPDTAWQYTKGKSQRHFASASVFVNVCLQAYFEETPEEAFGIVERASFEARLRAHFSGAMPDDKAWYALRNVLWASGCRIVLSRTASLRIAAQTAWPLFENALSAHTEILFTRSSMMGVQSLILMAYYSEGVGKMSLQYMLCSNAMRLACSKGMHRQPAHSWNVSPHEATHRNWMFWSIYCLEKQICSRSGRPSVMEDDEISCEVPQSALSGQEGDTMYCQILIELMLQSSTAKKRLSSARALRQTPSQLIETVRDLNKELDELKRAVQNKICLDGPLEVSKLPKGITLRQAQSLQSHYFCIVLDINTPVAHPWSCISSYAKQDMIASTQLEKSCNAVAQASRSAILATREIRVDASCSARIALYAPTYCFINLFIHILRDAPTSTTQSDLVLLNIALGYFSNLEFATDLELSLPFVREMCFYARLGVENNQRAIDEMKGRAEEHTPHSTIQTSCPLDFNGTDAFPANEDDFLGWFPDDNLEAWSTLLPLTESGDTLFGSF